MSSIVKRIFFKDTTIQTFFITRLYDEEIAEQVFLKQGNKRIDVTGHHAMICLDPFCVAAWLSNEEIRLIHPEKITFQFFKGKKLNASIDTSIIDKIPTGLGVLLLFQIDKAKNNHLTAPHRLVLFAYFLRSKKNTYHSRKVISALYSYPRRIIIVSYQDDEYYNIFPMDIQGYINEEGLYILGLRTTNVTLDKILGAKKAVICDTDSVDIKTVYDLGKHSSASPTPVEQLPFGTTKSELFGFPVPDFSGSYKEVEIIQNRKMGYQMLMIGKVLNAKEIKPRHSSLFHVGFLQFQKGNYKSIEGLF